MKAALLEMIRSGEDHEGGPQNVLHNIPNPEFVLPTWKKALHDLFMRIKVIPKTRVLMENFLSCVEEERSLRGILQNIFT